MDDWLAISPVFKALAVAGWFALFLILERLWPAAVPPMAARFPGPGWRRRLANFGLWGLNALLSLGYNDKEASWAAKQLPAGVSVNDGIRQALKLLSKST